MADQYLAAAQGKKAALVVPLKEWEAFQAKLRDLIHEELTPAEAAASASAFPDFLVGWPINLPEVKAQEKIKEKLLTSPKIGGESLLKTEVLRKDDNKWQHHIS
jgi:hypothetical protein